MSERGQLRVYLDCAPGVGKIYAMLDEGHRRVERGTDVVVAFVETHGRVHITEKLGDLEVLPRRVIAYGLPAVVSLPLARGGEPRAHGGEPTAHIDADRFVPSAPA